MSSHATATNSILVNETTLDQSNSTTVALADGGWVVSWSTYKGGRGYELEQRHYAPELTGTSQGDRLAGTAWGEMLFGFAGNDFDGGAGADIMTGGYGDDTYIVDHGRDAIRELALQGNDTVHAAVSFSLAGAGNVENLVLSGRAALKGSGNLLATTLTGNLGNNVLSGLDGNDRLTGGGGGDLLKGGAGIDTFVFGRNDGNDRIRDFDTSGDDHDLIDLRAVVAIADFDDLRANHLTRSGHDLVIETGSGHTITLEKVAIRDFDAADVLL